MADVKNLLKDARKLIDEKNYKDAQECCKNILRKDKQNYFALVLLGKSFEDSDQAPLAFQKAIASKPDHPLAWQGLANYYERKEDNTAKNKLISIYGEMLKLQLDEEKALEIINKLSQLGCALQSSEAVEILLTYLKKDLDSKICETAKREFIELLKSEIVFSEEYLSLALEALKKIYKKDPNSPMEMLIGKLILRKRIFSEAVEEVMNLDFFSTNVVLREHLCKYLCQKYVENNNTFTQFPIGDNLQKITEGIENSKYPGLLCSMISYDKKLYLEAYKQCVPLVNYHEADVMEATFIIKCTIKLKKWSVAQKLATNFLTKVKDQKFHNQLVKYLFLSLAKQRKWKQALSVLKGISLDDLTLQEQATYTECCIEAGIPENLIEKLRDSDYFIQLQALLFLKQENYVEIANLLEHKEDNALHLYYLAKAYWELKQYDKCHISLLKAAKLDPDHAHTFLYLGHFYLHHKQDPEKARKCYEKSYSLNNMDITIIKNLSDLYAKQSLSKEDFEFLITAQKNVQSNEVWLNFRLGLHYLNMRDWENAILYFRNVIKSEPNNATALECLADSYYSRGSFTSALRAYNKVMALNLDKTSHCLTRIGYINSLLTQYEEAVSTFERALKIDGNSLLGLKGIAETWMRVAKKKEAAKLYGAARDSAQNALNYTTKAIIIQRKFSCFWKLLADILMFVTKLPNQFAYVHIQNLQDLSKEELFKKEKLDVYFQAISCYSYISKQKQQNSSYDLASAYYNYYHETKKIEDCNLSFNLAVSCIKQKPTSWRSWNLLGKICLFVNKYDLAQHCFIKALLVTRKWSIAKVWCNLGTLYLKLKFYKLANYCFWRGQSTLPSYPQSWIGQGLIAEDIREEEAMDLFRHASRLGYHPESALGYADWVCRTLKKNYKEDPELKYVIEGLYAIPYAIDLVQWFSTFNPNNGCASTILGILQERSGLINAAFKSYEKALTYAEEDKKNIAFLNMGRILVRLGKYDEAIVMYKAITEASLNSTSGLALALFKKGLYEESYSAYDTALHWLSNEDDEKADLLVAMSGIVYMFKGADDAKTLLFHSIQISQKKPTAHSLFAICSLGLIHTDQSLSKLALSELKKYEKDSNFGFDIGFLKSYLLVCQDSMEDAIKLMSDSLHDHPSNAMLWFCLAQYCLKASNARARVASCCAQRALYSARDGACECNSAKIIAIASIAEHIAGDHKKALQLAKEGLHMYPNNTDIWAAILLSLLSNKLWAERKDWILKAAGQMRRHMDIARPLSRWVSLLERKLQLSQ